MSSTLTREQIQYLKEIGVKNILEKPIKKELLNRVLLSINIY